MSYTLSQGEPLLLETTIGRIVLLLPVAPDRAESELDASVKRLFDEGGSGNQTEQVDSIGGGKDVYIQPVIKAANTVVEDVAPMQPKFQGKMKYLVVDAGGASHPPKKSREDYGTPSGTYVSGKSRSALKRLLAGAVFNAEVEVAAIPTLPFMTTSISFTPEREGGDHIDSATGTNLHAIGAPPRFVIFLDSSHHSGTNVAEAEVDSLIRSSVSIMTTVTTITSTVDPSSVAKKKLVKPSLFCADSFSAGGTDPTTGVFSDLNGSDFLSMTNGSHLDDDRVCRDMVDEFAPPMFFASVRGMEHNQLFTEFNVRDARQMYLSVEVRMCVEYNVKEKMRLKSVAERQVELLKVKERGIENLKAQLLLREAEAAKAIRLYAQASNFDVVEKSIRDEMDALNERNAILEKERNALDLKVTKLEASTVNELEISSSELQEKVTVYESFMDQLEKFQDDRMKVVNDKFDKLYTDFVEMALHLEEKFYPHLLTTVSGRRWLLIHGMELAIVKCLNSLEYLSALRVAIGKAIEKGMQDGLYAGIVHGKEGMALTNVAAHNSSAEDASVEAVMNILRLEGPLAKKLGLNERQPNVDQLMVPIHRSPNKVVVDAIVLSLALDVSSFRVWRIRENIENQRLALCDVFVPLADPFSAADLTCTVGTSDTAPATADTNTALSTTFASASSIDPISVDYYEVVGAEDQAIADENVASFSNVDDAKLNIPE
uniref:Transposase (Putative), gypsy type n=1 Tax=Tanacetum cinerariifolium TaxID=118510 RepID=A0A6L2J8Z4_TANCI|nr:hypothetical protein [Tanacetum cinerariifolium]